MTPAPSGTFAPWSVWAGALLVAWGPVSALLGEGSTRVEGWIGRQLVAIAGDHLGPALVLGELDYQYPRTVTVTVRPLCLRVICAPTGGRRGSVATRTRTTFAATGGSSRGSLGSLQC